jgi:hypothetical protein
MPRCHIDFETRSLADLLRVGADAYAQHMSTSPLMLAYYVDSGVMPFGPEIIDFFADNSYRLTRYPNEVPNPVWPFHEPFAPACPPLLREAIERGDVVVAHNARFRAIYLVLDLPQAMGLAVA